MPMLPTPQMPKGEFRNVPPKAEVVNQYLEPYVKEVEWTLKAIDELVQVQKVNLSYVESRLKRILNIPKQYKFLFKIRNGISDDLKADVLPKNKNTGNVVKAQIELLNTMHKAVELADGLLKKCIRETQDVPKAKLFNQFAQLHDQVIGKYEQLRTKTQERFHQAEEDERKAYDRLNQYIEGKDEMQKGLKSGAFTKEQYEDFKKKWKNQLGELKKK